MYQTLVLLLMVVLPGLSVLWEHMADSPMSLLALVGKWFVFWGVGLRLFLAGLKQTTNPAYTAHKILGLKGEDVLMVVRELGLANLAMGILGIASLFVSEWIPAAALVGGTFYLLAAVNHLRQKHRNKLENFALASDAWAAVVLASCLLGWATARI